MQYTIHHPEAFPLLEVRLESGEQIKAESGAMVSMDETISVEGKAEGGLMKGLGRMLAGEKFFFQTLRAKGGAGTVTLAPASLGGVVALEVSQGQGYTVQKDGFLAATDQVSVDTQMQNLSKGFLSGEGFFVLNIRGSGTVFVNSHGAIHTLEVPEGKRVTIDNHHLVAWSEHMHYSIDKAAKGWISSMTSGEGLVCHFSGPGRILIQTRNPQAFTEMIRAMMPAK